MLEVQHVSGAQKLGLAFRDKAFALGLEFAFWGRRSKDQAELNLTVSWTNSDTNLLAPAIVQEGAISLSGTIKPQLGNRMPVPLPSKQPLSPRSKI